MSPLSPLNSPCLSSPPSSPLPGCRVPREPSSHPSSWTCVCPEGAGSPLRPVLRVLPANHPLLSKQKPQPQRGPCVSLGHSGSCPPPPPRTRRLGRWGRALPSLWGLPHRGAMRAYVHTHSTHALTCTRHMHTHARSLQSHRPTELRAGPLKGGLRACLPAAASAHTGGTPSGAAENSFSCFPKPMTSALSTPAALPGVRGATGLPSPWLGWRCPGGRWAPALEGAVAWLLLRARAPGWTQRFLQEAPPPKPQKLSVGSAVSGLHSRTW